MIVLAEPYARFPQSISRNRLEPAAKALLASADVAVREYYATEYGASIRVRVSVRVELGSTKAWVTVGGLTAALIFYGDVRTSIDYLLKDADSIARVVAPFVPQAMDTPNAVPSYSEARKGLPGQLNRMFREVRRGALSPDEATRRAVELIYARSGPDSLTDVPGLTEQLSVEFVDESKRRRRKTRTPQPLPKERPLLPLPATVIATRRRSGVIASVDAVTGKVRLSTY